MTVGEDHDVKLMLVGLTGKVDLLAAKVDAQTALLEQKLESSAREAKQLVELLGARVQANKERLDTYEKRFVNIVTEWDRKVGELSMEKGREHEQMQDEIDALMTFRTQAKTVIALIVFLMPIITAVVLKALNIK